MPCMTSSPPGAFSRGVTGRSKRRCPARLLRGVSKWSSSAGSCWPGKGCRWCLCMSEIGLPSSQSVYVCGVLTPCQATYWGMLQGINHHESKSSAYPHTSIIFHERTLERAPPPACSAMSGEEPSRSLGMKTCWEASGNYPLVMSKELLKMAIERVRFPIRNGDFPWLC